MKEEREYFFRGMWVSKKQGSSSPLSLQIRLLRLQLSPRKARERRTRKEMDVKSVLSYVHTQMVHLPRKRDRLVFCKQGFILFSLPLVTDAMTKEWLVAEKIHEANNTVRWVNLFEYHVLKAFCNTSNCTSPKHCENSKILVGARDVQFWENGDFFIQIKWSNVKTSSLN